MRLSENFTLDEFTFSNTAVRKGIDNYPEIGVINNLKELCINVLEPIRLKLGKPLQITSGYRSPALNKAIGGAKNSQHVEGKAADIKVSGMTTEELYQFCKVFVHDQVICEFPDSIGGGWVHISWNGINNRNQDLRAVKKNGKTVYLAG